MGKKSVKDQAANRKVIYPDRVGRIWQSEADSITSDYAKELLGWEEISDKEEAFITLDRQITDAEGDVKKTKVYVKCTNNVSNRPLDNTRVQLLEQELLNKRWRVNGETIIIGRTGLILNGQHSLVAVIGAEEQRSTSTHWKDIWGDTPVTLAKDIIFGNSEDDDTVNTMDTCKPRSLDDVIYRSPYFNSMKKDKRKQASSMAASAIKILWSRTGVYNAFAPRRTHSESLDFLDRHQRILRAVKHIANEDTAAVMKNSHVSLGYAAGLLYLMAASDSDVDAYRLSDPPSEKKISFKCWDEACEFWTLLASGAEAVYKPIMFTLRKFTGENGMGESATHEEKMTILCKAWTAFRENKEVKTGDLKLKYSAPNEDGERQFLEASYNIGGIDLGGRANREAKAEAETEPTEEEVEATKALIRAEKEAKAGHLTEEVESNEDVLAEAV